MTDSIAEFFNEERIQQFQTILTNFTQFSEQLKNHEKVWLSTVKHVDEIMVALLEAKGTMGQLLMKQDFLNRLDASLAQMDRVLKEAQNIAGDLKPAAKAVAQEIETLKGILADIKEGTQEFPGLMESAGEATQGGKEVVDAVKANPLIRMTLPKDKPSQPLKVEPRHVP
jgi:ABC-type transporter Mla subunit MlaD